MQNSLKAEEVYSPRLSILKHLIMQPYSFSTSHLNALNISSACDFFFKIYVQVFLLKSLVKVRKYLLPALELGLIGPHI